MSRIFLLHERFRIYSDRCFRRWLAYRINIDDPGGFVGQVLVSMQDRRREKLATTPRGGPYQVLECMGGIGLAVPAAATLSYVGPGDLQLIRTCNEVNSWPIVTLMRRGA